MNDYIYSVDSGRLDNVQDERLNFQNRRMTATVEWLFQIYLVALLLVIIVFILVWPMY